MCREPKMTGDEDWYMSNIEQHVYRIHVQSSQHPVPYKAWILFTEMDTSFQNVIFITYINTELLKSYSESQKLLKVANIEEKFLIMLSKEHRLLRPRFHCVELTERWPKSIFRVVISFPLCLICLPLQIKLDPTEQFVIVSGRLNLSGAFDVAPISTPPIHLVTLLSKRTSNIWFGCKGFSVKITPLWKLL